MDNDERSKAQLKRELRELKILHRETHFWVKNLLLTLYELMELQLDYVTDEPAQAPLRRTQRYLKLCNHTYGAYVTYHSEEPGTMPSNYLDSIVQDLKMEFKTDQRGITITTRSEIQSFLGNILLLGVITQELLLNSLEHAFPEGQSGDIFAIWQHHQDGALITVRDNGVGVPKDFDWKTTDTFGWSLIRKLIQNRQGEVILSRHKGTQVMVSLES